MCEWVHACVSAHKRKVFLSVDMADEENQANKDRQRSGKSLKCTTF